MPSTPHDAGRSGHGAPEWVLLLALMVLATALRAYRLDGQLWLDEISALVLSYRRPLLEIATRFPGFIPDPLYAFLAHLSLRAFGESALAIRLPAAIFGVAGVAMFYGLARRLADPIEAALAGGLLAVSYHHIFFSQNARGYTAFLFFGLAATHLMCGLLQAMRWRTAAAYAGVSALAAYASPFGAFIPAGQLLVAMLLGWFRRERTFAGAPSPLQALATGALTALLITLLFLPFLSESLTFSLTAGRQAAHGPRVLGLLPEILEGLRAALFGWPGVAAATAVGIVGLFDYTRRQPAELGVLTAPLVLAAVAAGVGGVGVHARYFLLALPVGYLIAARGLVTIVRAVLGWGLHVTPRRAAAVQGAIVLMVLLVASWPLLRYYSYPKQDFLGAVLDAETLAADGGRVVAATLAGHAIRDYYRPGFPVVENVDDLLQVEGEGQRVVVITTLERVMAQATPELLSRLRTRYRLARVLPGTLGDGAMRIYIWEPDHR